MLARFGANGAPAEMQTELALLVPAHRACARDWRHRARAPAAWRALLRCGRPPAGGAGHNIRGGVTRLPLSGWVRRTLKVAELAGLGPARPGENVILVRDLACRPGAGAHHPDAGTGSGRVRLLAGAAGADHSLKGAPSRPRSLQ